MDDGGIKDVAERASELSGIAFNPESVCLLNNITGKVVADAAFIFSIRDAIEENEFVFHVSSAGFSSSVKDAAEKAIASANSLTPVLASSILRPILTDVWEGRSFAVYPKLYPFSQNKIICKLQKSHCQESIYLWLAEIAKETKTSVDEHSLKTAFCKPYEYLIQETALTGALRRRAEKAAAALTDGSFEPVTVLEHGDFWLGNILLCRPLPLSFLEPRFVIIDWGASVSRGRPFYDLVRFFDSIAGDAEKLKGRLNAYAHRTGINFRDTELYVLAALGHLGLNRNQFPKERYVQLAEKCADLAFKANE